MRIPLLVGLALLASACETTPEERSISACTTICGCTEAALPAIQKRCVDDCTQQASTQISDECLACVTGHDRCSTIEEVCEPICDPPNPQDDGGIGI